MLEVERRKKKIILVVGHGFDLESSAELGQTAFQKKCDTKGSVEWHSLIIKLPIDIASCQAQIKPLLTVKAGEQLKFDIHGHGSAGIDFLSGARQIFPGWQKLSQFLFDSRLARLLLPRSWFEYNLSSQVIAKYIVDLRNLFLPEKSDAHVQISLKSCFGGLNGDNNSPSFGRRLFKQLKTHNIAFTLTARRGIVSYQSKNKKLYVQLGATPQEAEGRYKEITSLIEQKHAQHLKDQGMRSYKQIKRDIWKLKWNPFNYITRARREQLRARLERLRKEGEAYRESREKIVTQVLDQRCYKLEKRKIMLFHPPLGFSRLSESTTKNLKPPSSSTDKTVTTAPRHERKTKKRG